MPYTFGAAANHDITWANPNLLANAGKITLVCGWWRPTTLTAARGLWSAGNTIGAEIDTTTDELRLRTDNTTDGQWTTTGVDLAVNEWKFIAFVLSTVSTPAAVWRVWAGNVETAPQPVTVTVATALVGAFTGNVNFYVGNKGTSTSLAFQGDIADVTLMDSGSSEGAPTHPFGTAAYGVISDIEAQFIYEKFVLPIWLGDPGQLAGTLFASWHHNGLDIGAIPIVNIGTAMPKAVTINGAVWSQNGAPRPNPGMDILTRPRR